MRRKVLETALGAGGRRFESYRPDHYLLVIPAVYVLGHFLFIAFFLRLIQNVIQKRWCLEKSSVGEV